MIGQAMTQNLRADDRGSVTRFEHELNSSRVAPRWCPTLMLIRAHRPIYTRMCTHTLPVHRPSRRMLQNGSMTTIVQLIPARYFIRLT